MPRSSTSVMGLDDEKGCQVLRPRGPSSMLPFSLVINDAFDKFEHDFQAANLPEGKYIEPPPSTAKWYKVGQPCYEEKIQELNTDFAKICITPKPPGAPTGKVPLPILKELEHQARQKISTLNFTAAFAKTSSCNATLEKCQHSLKSTFKRVKSQIQKDANPEKAAKRGYEQAFEYIDLWNKTVLIQHRALTCLCKSLAHILQREVYTMGNTGAKDPFTTTFRGNKTPGTHPFGIPPCEGGGRLPPQKKQLTTLRVSDPIKISPFVVLTTRKEAPTGNTPMGATPHKAVTKQ